MVEDDEEEEEEEEEIQTIEESVEKEEQEDPPQAPIPVLKKTVLITPQKREESLNKTELVKIKEE